MSQGVIRSESTRGYWFVEDHESHRSFFVHHSQVADERFLHIGDIVQFEIVPNPVRHDQKMAGSVRYIGCASVAEAVRR
jgi:cold shock CspA family protein